MTRVVLAENSYGKSAIRLVKVTREGARHDLHDLTVDVAFEGDFEAAHAAGDNSAVLPTDTMKNTVYALAARHGIAALEAFGAVLGRHFLGACAAAHRVRVSLAQHIWTRLDVDGHAHDHAFVHAGAERRTAAVTVARDAGGDAARHAATVEAGIADLMLLKSSGSGFERFMRDRYTTLAETSDRILATSLTARWRYASERVSFGPLFHGVRRTLLATFAEHESRSVQHTLYAMGEAVLNGNRDVEEIHLSMPNRHHLRVDLKPFGIDDGSGVFVATSEPYGLIEARLARE